MKRWKFVALILFIVFLSTNTVFATFISSFEGRYIGLKGTIDGQYKIRMLLYPKDNQLVGNYLYEPYEQKIRLTGHYDDKMVTLIEYDDQGNQTAMFSGEFIDEYHKVKGVWQNSLGNTTYDFELQTVAVFSGSLENLYIAAGARSTDEVDKFAAELKNDILNGNKYAVASKVVYPRPIYIKGERVTINSEEEFVEQFDEIFYPEYVQAIAKCAPIYMDSKSSGIMFGDKGQIWLGYFSGVGLKVKGINNRPEDMRYFLTE